MQIRIEKFLAITAMLAGTALAAGGCVSEEETDATGGTGGVGGTGGGTGGSAGSSTGGTAGASTGGTAGASTGGTAGASGSAGSAGAAGDAGTECLGDDLADPDAGTEGFDCSTLPYWTASCLDAGAEFALGADLCSYMSANGRPGVVEALGACLNAIGGDPCSAAHDTAVQGCIDTVFPQACAPAPIMDADGGVWDVCGEVEASCPTSGAGGGITKAQCLTALGPFTEAGQLQIATCYNNGTGACEDDFNGCVFNF